jgi:hypothetical protein
MIPAALANIFYSKDIPFAPAPAPIGYTANSNVIPVDFVAKVVMPHVNDATSAADTTEFPEWRTIATQRLSALHRFLDGWDGDGSLAVAATALAKADRILGFAFEGIAFAAPPVAVPCADGSLQLEWWLTDTRFELSIESNGEMESWALDRSSGQEASAVGTAAIELLSRWSGRLTADKLAQQA